MKFEDIEKWDHMHLEVSYVGQAKDFAYKSPTGEIVVGLDDIIGYWASRGFILITAQASSWMTFDNNENGSNTMVDRYSLFLRRPWID